MQKIEQALNLPPAFFWRPVVEQSEERRIFYRSMKSATKQARTRMDRRHDWLKEIANHLKEFVNFPPVFFPLFEVPRDPRELSHEDIEELASQTRKYWGLGEGPISNVVSLLENNGALVARGMMEADELDAFSEWTDHDESPFTFLGADKHSAPRSRYDAAHELGHLALHRCIDKKHIDNKRTFDIIEKQAHRFAGAFLLPASSFANDFYAPNLDSFRALKSKWKTSVAMMISRSADLGFVSKEQTRRLWINHTRRGWKFKEPLDDQLPIEKPQVLRRAFELLVNEGIETRTEIRTALPYSLGDIEELSGLTPHFLGEKPAPVSIREYSRKRRGRAREKRTEFGEVVNLWTAGDASGD